ncbi:MAG: hypothetical protein ACPF9D_04165 [Owenweeksia sp.]
MKYYFLTLFTVLVSVIGFAQTEQDDATNDVILIKTAVKTWKSIPLHLSKSTDLKLERSQYSCFYSYSSRTSMVVISLNAILEKHFFNGLPSSFANYETWPYKDPFGRDEGSWSLQFTPGMKGDNPNDQFFSGYVVNRDNFGKWSIAQL